MTGVGEFVWGSDAWGVGGPEAPPSPLTLSTTFTADFIATDYIAIQLIEFVRIDSFFKDPTNYVISVLDNSPLPGDPVLVQSVLLPPLGDAVATDIVYLQTTPHTVGAYYSVSFTVLYNPDGVLVSLPTPVNYEARVTKPMLEMKSLPAHFDGSVNSLIRNVVTAISLSDDKIGGSMRNNL